ncbi:MAG: hypothetical protein HC865_21585 [Cyanobacteria bacterium RU_5_0]|nr:hypothetical protein [Cyanobacteria bacterium RU_5_0]
MSQGQSAIDGDSQLTTRLERTGRSDRCCSIGYWQPLILAVIPRVLCREVAENLPFRIQG